MKKCPYCAEQIQNAAIVCKHCGQDLPQPDPGKTSKGLSCTAIVALMLVIFLASLAIRGQDRKGSSTTSTPRPTSTITSTPAPTATPDPNRLDSSEVGKYIYLAQEHVKGALKSPSTAKFPGMIFEQDQWRLSKKAGIITVQSWVDAQNSYGAVIRNQFTAKYDSSSEKLTYLEVDGRKVYP